jgi:LacI family gluconate utilization system Gnt-I transcriptional repressor
MSDESNPGALLDAPGAPTLATVAKAAGVSSATVSRFINSPERVAEETATRIRQAIADTGYVPNLLAGGLASSRSRLVALVIPALDQSIFSSTIQSITNTLGDEGYQIVLGLGGVTDERVERLVPSILGRRPDGLILTGTVTSPQLRKMLVAAGVPIIETWDLPPNPIDSVVGFSHVAIGRSIAEYVVQKGYKRPCILTTGGVRALARRYGFARTMIEYGQAEPMHMVVDVPTTFSRGREAMRAMLEAGTRADVVVCASDWLAHGAMTEALHRGLAIPDDIAFIGFGDLEFAEALTPPLTTIAIDGTAIGSEAANLFLNRALGRSDEKRIVDVGFTLLPRQSA